MSLNPPFRVTARTRCNARAKRWIQAEVKGEVAWVFCVLAPGQSATEEDVRGLVAGELGKAFAPAGVLFVPALPKTRSAKIVRRAVRAAALGRDPGDTSSIENPEALAAIDAVLA